MTEACKVQSHSLAVRTKGTLNVVVVLDPADLESANVPLATPGIDLRLHVGPLAAVQPDADFLRGAAVLFVQLSPGDPGAQREVERIARQSFPHVPVIAAVRDLTLADTRRIMRLGVVDVVPLPLNPEDFAQALEIARDVIAKSPAAQGRHGRSVAFLKSVGGVGATALATQTGCMLGTQYARDGKDVCLIDFDVQFGSAAVHLDLKPSLGLGDLLSAGARLDGELVRSVTTPHPSGLRLIAAPETLIPLEAVDTDTALAIVELAMREFDVVLVDLPTAWTSWSLSILAQADAACLVTEMTVPSIRQARRQMDLLEEQGIEDLQLYIVANRVERSWLKTIDLSEAEQVLRHKVDFSIANDFRTVSAAIDLGKMVGEIKSGSRVQRDLSQFTKALTARFGLDAGQAH